MSLIRSSSLRTGAVVLLVLRGVEVSPSSLSDKMLTRAMVDGRFSKYELRCDSVDAHNLLRIVNPLVITFAQ